VSIAIDQSSIYLCESSTASTQSSRCQFWELIN